MNAPTTRQEPRYGDFDAQAVLAALGSSRDHAVTKAALVERLGSHWSERDVKRAVNQLRMDGWLIASGNEGYWLADEVDVEEWLRRQLSQIKAMARTYRKVRSVARLRAARVEQQQIWSDAA